MHVLEKYLRDHSLTQEEFAKKALICRPTIWRILGGRPVRPGTARRIVRATEKKITLKDLGHGQKEKFHAPG